jgi:hypothetical protein
MDMRQKTWRYAALAALVFYQLQGCSSGSEQSAQPKPLPTQPAAQQAASIDLTPELNMYAKIAFGKTTLDEMVKQYGKPVKMATVASPFRTEMEEKKDKAPQIEEILASFKVNPLTGEPADAAVPFFFTKGKKQVLVAAPILLARGDLRQKLKEKKLTLEDVRRVYGEPAREIEGALEYYDFEHHISLLVFLDQQGNISTLLTKYDLLYGNKEKDMKLHEEVIKVSKQADSSKK